MIIWPLYGTDYINLKEAHGHARKLCKDIGIQAAAVFFHPYRIPDAIKEAFREYKTKNHLDPAVGFWSLAHQDVLGLGGIMAYVT